MGSFILKQFKHLCVGAVGRRFLFKLMLSPGWTLMHCWQGWDKEYSYVGKKGAVSVNLFFIILINLYVPHQARGDQRAACNLLVCPGHGTQTARLRGKVLLPTETSSWS